MHFGALCLVLSFLYSWCCGQSIRIWSAEPPLVALVIDIIALGGLRGQDGHGMGLEHGLHPC